MNKTEFEAMRAEKLAKANELKASDNVDDLNAVLAEIEKLDADFEASAVAAANAVASVEGAKPVNIENLSENIEGKVADKMNTNTEHNYTANSNEYRNGFLKNLLGQDLTAAEQSAIDYVMTTTDSTYGSGNVLPTTLANEIWDLIEEQHSILGDIDMYRTGTVLEIAKRTAIAQGDAKVVEEAAANDDEVNTFAKVTLSGKDFSKHVDISYAMAKMSLDAFEDFLRTEIADRIGNALAADVIAQILSDYDDDNNAVTTASEGVVAFTDLTAAFAKLKNLKGNVVVYASNPTIYQYLVGMVDSTGRPVFQQSVQEGARGSVLGASIKQEDALSDGVILIGSPKQVVGNMIQDIMVESDRDIKHHVITYSGYARFESKLLAPKAFATLTVDLGE